MTPLSRLNQTVVHCCKCPRLVRWREASAKNPPRRYQGERYWAKPLPGFGDPHARVLIVGLAPAANGGNRTGRMFTGDRSGDWLYGALHAFGFANQANSDHRSDGLKLKDCYITAAVRCAPPGNKPLRAEFERCRPYLVQELKLINPSTGAPASAGGSCSGFRPTGALEGATDLPVGLHKVRVVVVLGKIAFDSFLAAYRENGGVLTKPRPKFGHAISVVLPDGLRLICSYHPSQQNTFTGKLTRPMFHRVFEQARAILSA